MTRSRSVSSAQRARGGGITEFVRSIAVNRPARIAGHVRRGGGASLWAARRRPSRTPSRRSALGGDASAIAVGNLDDRDRVAVGIALQRLPTCLALLIDWSSRHASRFERGGFFSMSDRAMATMLLPACWVSRTTYSQPPRVTCHIASSSVATMSGARPKKRSYHACASLRSVTRCQRTGHRRPFPQAVTADSSAASYVSGDRIGELSYPCRRRSVSRNAWRVDLVAVAPNAGNVHPIVHSGGSACPWACWLHGGEPEPAVSRTHCRRVRVGYEAPSGPGMSAFEK